MKSCKSSTNHYGGNVVSTLACQANNTCATNATTATSDTNDTIDTYWKMFITIPFYPTSTSHVLQLSLSLHARRRQSPRSPLAKTLHLLGDVSATQILCQYPTQVCAARKKCVSDLSGRLPVLSEQTLPAGSRCSGPVLYRRQK